MRDIGLISIHQDPKSIYDKEQESFKIASTNSLVCPSKTRSGSVMLHIFVGMRRISIFVPLSINMPERLLHARSDLTTALSL